jgi:hypothetical protein
MASTTVYARTDDAAVRAAVWGPSSDQPDSWPLQWGGARITAMAEHEPCHVELRRKFQVALFFGFLLFPLAPIALGLWRAQEWARVTFGIISAVIAAGGVGQLAFHFMDSLPVHKTAAAVVLTAGWASLAFHLLRPGAREEFEAARESIARARAVPG